MKREEIALEIYLSIIDKIKLSENRSDTLENAKTAAEMYNTICETIKLDENTFSCLN